MKKLLLTVVSFLVLVPSAVNAATINYSQNYTLNKGEKISDNLYNLSESTDIEGVIEGDLFNASNIFSHTGTTTEDLFIASGDAEIKNNVAGDLRIAGARVFIKGNIGGELLATGSEIILDETTSISEDVIIAGSRVKAKGTMEEDLQVYGQQVTINGKVSGDVDIQAQKVVVKDNTQISGDLSYSAKTKADIPEGVVQGDVNFTTQDITATTTSIESYFSRSWFVGLLVSLITTLVLFSLFKDKIQEITHYTLHNFGKESLRGLVLIFISPLILILLFSSVIGFWFGIILTGILAIMMSLAKVGAGYLVGMLINKLLNKKEVLTWNNITIGVIFIELLALIPIVGWILELLIYITVFGGIVYQTYLRTKLLNK